MTDAIVTFEATWPDQKARAKALAAAYRRILSWPVAQGMKTESATADLGGDEAADSATCSSASADETPVGLATPQAANKTHKEANHGV